MVYKAQEYRKTLGRNDPSLTIIAGLLDTISAIQEELRIAKREREQSYRKADE